MRFSTTLLAVVCVALIAALGAVWWYMGTIPDIPLRGPDVGGSLAVGLAGEDPKEAGREFYSASVLLWDHEAQVIRAEEFGFAQRPIASITKLMTAMVALDHGINWEQRVTIERDEYVVGGKLVLHEGEEVTMRDLWHAMLMGSANNATLALVRSLGLASEDFVQEMNRKAISLGLEQTRFTDVTGLDPDNVSTAYEVARLAEVAFRDYVEISETTGRVEYGYVIGGSGREHTLRNTNRLLTRENVSVTGGKTGYLYEAEFCLVVQGTGRDEARIAVALGSPSEWANLTDIKELLRR